MQKNTKPNTTKKEAGRLAVVVEESRRSWAGGGFHFHGGRFFSRAHLVRDLPVAAAHRRGRTAHATRVDVQ